MAVNPRALVIALAIAPLLAACVVGPDYELPKQAEVNDPAAQGPFVSAQDNAAVSADTLPTHWWRLYDDPNLDRLIPEALAANTDLRVAEANLERSKALVDLAKSERLPNLGVQFGIERAQLSAEQYLFPGQIPVSTLYDTGVTASWDPDLFGRIKRGIETAAADDEAVTAARDLVRVSVAAEVARAYVDICSSGNELAVAHVTLALQQQSLDFTEQLQKLGRGADLDVSRSRVLVSQLQASIPALEGRQRNALYRLAALSGKPPAAFEKELTSCSRVPAPTKLIPVGDGAALLKRRPDVRAAERQLAASTAEIGVATAALYPHIAIGAQIGSVGAIEDFATKPTNEWAIGPVISWQLNQTGPRARIAAAEASTKAQLARFDGVVLNALKDVETALNTYDHDLVRERNLTEARDDAATAAAQARRLEVNGRSNALATLDAERTLAQASTALAALQSQIAFDQVGLFLALGGGWEANDEQAPGPGASIQ